MTPNSSSWRAVGGACIYLVQNSETGTSLKLRVLNLSKRELAATSAGPSSSTQSQMFKKIYENGFGTPGVSPTGR